MVLLSQMFRSAAVTGRTEGISAWFGGRQGGRWAEQTVRAAMPTRGHPATGATAARRDPADTLRQLTELRQRDVITDAELERLRGDLNI